LPICPTFAGRRHRLSGRTIGAMPPRSGLRAAYGCSHICGYTLGVAAGAGQYSVVKDQSAVALRGGGLYQNFASARKLCRATNGWCGRFGAVTKRTRLAGRRRRIAERVQFGLCFDLLPAIGCGCVPDKPGFDGWPVADAEVGDVGSLLAGFVAIDPFGPSSGTDSQADYSAK
jgi:hypothetical protein